MSRGKLAILSALSIGMFARGAFQPSHDFDVRGGLTPESRGKKHTTKDRRAKRKMQQKSRRKNRK